MRRGLFITLEGGEGAGKSTQASLLADALRDDGVAVLVTREPGGAPGAEEIRRLLLDGAANRWDPMAEALLHFAARREHLTRTIEPALSQGVWVISDRFADSTMAYQGYGLGLGRDVIDGLYAQVIGDFRPDLTLVLDLPVEQGLARAKGRGTGADRYESMDVEFHRRLRDGFLEIAARDPGRCMVIDATLPLDDVGRAVIAAVRDRLKAASP